MSVVGQPQGDESYAAVAPLLGPTTTLRLTVGSPQRRQAHLVSVPETLSFSVALVEVLLRPCLRGEERLPDGTCLPCTASFFSVSPEYPCEPCPQGALCPGGAVVVPRDGYWHSSPLSG